MQIRYNEQIQTRMKQMEKKCIFIAALFFAVSCCKHYEIPSGYWQSREGKPVLRISKDSLGTRSATIYHRIARDELCPLTYPIVTNNTGTYIQAERRIFLTYNPEDNTLFLSPGGRYYQHTDSIITNK